MWGLALAAIAVAVLIGYLQSASFGDLVAGRLETALEPYLERDVVIESLRLKLLPLGAEIEGLTIGGPEPQDPPLMVLPKVVVDAELGSLRRPSVLLHQVRLEQPRFHLDFFAPGSNNLPRIGRRSATAEPRRRPLRVSVRSFAIVEGSLELNQHRLPLELTAQGLNLELSGRRDLQLQGRVAAREVEIALPRARPVIGAVGMRVAFEPRGLRLLGGKISAPDLALTVSGQVDWADTREVLIEVVGQGNASFFERLGYLEQQISGPFDIDGGLAWRSEAWGFRGEMSSPGLEVFGRRLRDIRGVVSGDRNGFEFDVEESSYGDGVIKGRVALEVDPDAKGTEIDLVLSKVDLEQLLDDQSIPVKGISSRVSGVVGYRFALGAAEQGQGWADLRIEAEQDPQKGQLSLEGSVPLIIERGVVYTQAARLISDRHLLWANGTYDLARDAGRFDYRVETDRVEELLTLLPLPASEEPALWLPRSGYGEAEGVLVLEPGRPSTELQLVLSDVEAPGASAEQVQGRMAISRGGIEELRLELLRPEGGLILTGSVPFAGVAPPAVAPAFTIDVDAAGWPMEEVRPWLPFESPVTGPISGSLLLWGEIDRPTGALQVRIEPALYEGLVIDALELDLDFDAERTLLRRASLETEAGELTLSGVMSSLDESLDVEVAAASLDLAREPFVSLLGGDLAGFLDATGTVSGNLRQPDVIADLAWRDLAVGGRSLGREGRAELRLTMAQGELEVQGDFLGLVAVEGGGVADRGGFQLELGVSGDDLQGLLGLTAIEPVPDVQGSFQGTLALAGEFGGAEPWHAELELVEVGVEYASRRLQNLEPIVVRLEREAVILESLFVGDSESGSELFVAGRVGFEEARSIDLNLESSLETSWLQLLLPELGLREGRLDLLATVVGSISQPRFNGLGRLSGGRLLVPDLPHSLDRMEGLFLLNIGEIVVDQLQAEMAGGKVQAGGSMQLAEAGGEPTYRLQIAAVGLNLRYPENWLSRADAELSVASVEGGRSVRGAVRLDRAYYLQDVKMSLPQLLQGLFVQRRVEVETADELALTTQLNISVEGPGALRVRNNMADLRGDVDLIVRGTLARPIVFGRVEIDRGGTLSYAGTKYSVDNGVLNFANPFRIEPVIDLAASARVREYDVTLNLFGTLDRLNASFSSDPPLADLEVLSLITTGEETWTGPSSSVNGEASAATQATGLLYGQAASLISQRTSRLFGFDRVRLEPLTTSSGDLSTARVTVGKQVSRDLFITYSYDPSTTEQQIIQLEWNVVQGMTVVLTQEGDESYSVDLRWEKSF